uniref:Uncharacterized protein n=1 Tax=Rhizophora mucronata TaxID=61149 RepID=A0A2P2QBV9_RHIMU
MILTCNCKCLISNLKISLTTLLTDLLTNH